MRRRRPDRVLFRADGRFTRLRFSPSGRWLLVAWPLADQWVYLGPAPRGPPSVEATARVSAASTPAASRSSGLVLPA